MTSRSSKSSAGRALSRPDALFESLTRAQLEQTYASMRIVRVLSRRILRWFNCPPADTFEIDPEPTEPEITGKPVRRVLSRSAVSHKGWVFSRRTGEILPWESRPELDAVTRLDCMPGVTAIYTQPITIEFTCPYEKRRRRATPDIFAEINRAVLLLEVKRNLADLKEPERRHFKLLEKLFGRAGVEYRLWSHDEIREEPDFSNAVWLARYNAILLTNADKLAILQFFNRRDRARLAEVSQFMGDAEQLRSFAMLMRSWLVPEPGESVRDNPFVQINPAFVGA